MVYQGLAPSTGTMLAPFGVPLVFFVGRSNTGKTNLLEIVIREMAGRGYRVAAIKHGHHDFEIDRPGKDTWRLAAADSQAVAISSPTRMALIERPETELSLADIQARIGAGVDVILAEGFKQSGVAKIRVVADPASDDGLRDLSDILLTVSPQYAGDGRPCFDPDDVAAIVEILLARISGRIAHEASHHRSDANRRRRQPHPGGTATPALASSRPRARHLSRATASGVPWDSTISPT